MKPIKVIHQMSPRLRPKDRDSVLNYFHHDFFRDFLFLEDRIRAVSLLQPLRHLSDERRFELAGGPVYSIGRINKSSDNGKNDRGIPD